MAKVLTLEEVAEYLRVHPSTVYRLIKQSQIPAFKIGSDWRFNQESLDRWMYAREGSQGLRKARLSVATPASSASSRGGQ